MIDNDPGWLSSQPDVHVQRSREKSTDSKSERNVMFYHDGFTSPFRPFRGRIQHSLFLEDLYAQGKRPPNKSKNQEYASLILFLLFMRMHMLMEWRAQAICIARWAKKIIGKKELTERSGETHLGYREHSLTVYLLASHARNRWKCGARGRSKKDR